LGASGGDRLERFLLILAGACLVASLIFARQGLALIRHARRPRASDDGSALPYDPDLSIIASWDDFTLE
jgi:hypothetical protein